MELLLALGLFLSTHRDLEKLPHLSDVLHPITITTQAQLVQKPTPTLQVKKVVKSTQSVKKVVKNPAVQSKATVSKTVSKKLQCVQYARQISTIQIKGNANTWVSTAKKQGYKVSTAPVVGAVLSEPGLSKDGHVSVVIASNEKSFTVKEANYISGKITTREIHVTGSQQFIIPKS